MTRERMMPEGRMHLSKKRSTLPGSVLVTTLVTLLTLFGAGSLRAQVAWDSPLLVSPDAPAGWGVYLVDPSPGSSIGFLTTWRSGGPVGYRLGLAEDAGEDLSVFGGFDYSGGLVRAGADIPFNIDWITGAGFAAGDAFVLSFPLGIAIGRAFQADAVLFNPYMSPRMILDAVLNRDDRDDHPPFRDGRGDGDLHLGLAVDLGVDISFDPGWAVRFGASLGDRSGIAIGLSFRVF
ncbi:MAG: hypothetical protein WD013_02530 [Gemmatimonadota bacterium]